MIKSLEFEKKIFVVGCSRSGTTLLQSILMNIENSFSMPETHFFEILPDNHYIAPRSLPPFGRFEYPQFIGEKTFKRVVDFLVSNSNFPADSTLLPGLREKLKSGQLKPGIFFEELTRQYSAEGRNILIEKTPSHIFHVPFIRETFPDAIIFNIVRDPRDVFLSFQKMLRRAGKVKRSVSEFTHLWNKAFDYCIKLKLETFRYEDLIERPVEITNEMLSKHGLKIQDVEKNSYEAIVNRKETWKGKLKGKIIKDNTKKYLKGLTGREISHIEKMCEKGMKHFGYEKERGRGQKMGIDIGDVLSFRALVAIIRVNIFKTRLKSWLGNAI